MKVLTEADLREELKNKAVDRYRVEPGTLITPSARQYLADRKITLVEESYEIPAVSESNLPPDVPRPKYTFNDFGGFFNEKPEHFTHLRGNRLVPKNHPSIVFRGKMDSLEAIIIQCQTMAEKGKNQALIDELQEMLDFCRKMLRAEVVEEELADIRILGMSDDELREKSHHPRKYFGIDHFFPHYTMGDLMAWLNYLRTQIRETEIAAVSAFAREGKPERKDILMGLNRLSSCAYILMCKLVSGTH